MNARRRPVQSIRVHRGARHRVVDQIRIEIEIRSLCEYKQRVLESATKYTSHTEHTQVGWILMLRADDDEEADDEYIPSICLRSLW